MKGKQITKIKKVLHKEGIPIDDLNIEQKSDKIVIKPNHVFHSEEIKEKLEQEGYEILTHNRREESPVPIRVSLN
jgi:hypothetical protein